MPDTPVSSGHWFHFVETVYGAWLYGDARGFRTRHHREHVDGDYKSPPRPGKYDEKLNRSRVALKQSVVIVADNYRQVIGAAIVERLQDLGGFVLCLAMGGQHLHALAMIPDEVDARTWMGLAKKHSNFEAKKQGWQGKLWGRRGKEVRVRDRKHQRNVYLYILDHAKEGAWIYDWTKKKTRP